MIKKKRKKSLTQLTFFLDACPVDNHLTGYFFQQGQPNAKHYLMINFFHYLKIFFYKNTK